MISGRQVIRLLGDHSFYTSTVYLEQYVPHPHVATSSPLNSSQSGTHTSIIIDNHPNDERANPPIYAGSHLIEKRLAFDKEYCNYVDYINGINASRNTKLQILRRYECMSQDVLKTMLEYQREDHIEDKHGNLVENWKQLVDDYLQVRGVYRLKQFRAQHQALMELREHNCEFHNVSEFQEFIGKVTDFFRQHNVEGKEKNVEEMLCKVVLTKLQPEHFKETVNNFIAIKTVKSHLSPRKSFRALSRVIIRVFDEGLHHPRIVSEVEIPGEPPPNDSANISDLEGD